MKIVTDALPDNRLVSEYSWEVLLASGIQGLINSIPNSQLLGLDHLEKTPSRVVKAFSQYFSGVYEDPSAILESAKFKTTATTSQMIHVKNIPFFSICAHHFVVFYGKATFSYIPKDHIVGLSKIPRMIEALARRPQVQESLTDQIVDIFMSAVSPEGCGLVMKAYHMCMLSRGVRSPAFTETTAVRGSFLTNPATKSEFISCAAVNGERFTGL